MSDLKQARTLLEAGAKDVSALRGMGDEVIFADEIFGFHVQQAVEKLLKAWLASLGEFYHLSHDLASLLDMGSSRNTRFVFRIRKQGVVPVALEVGAPEIQGLDLRFACGNRVRRW